MNKIISFFMAVISFFSSLFGSAENKPYFKNEYTVPEKILPYTRIETAPKTDWKAKFIWDSSDGSEENVWMCLRKTVALEKVPQTLTAFISADSKYWLYINGETVVFEGGVKRGPAPDGSYYDSVDIASFLKPGKNTMPLFHFFAHCLSLFCTLSAFVQARLSAAENCCKNQDEHI